MNSDAAFVRPLQPNPVQVATLVALGRSWAFLKYHHRAITDGEFDWDVELLRVMPDVLAAASEREGFAVVASWAQALGMPHAMTTSARAADRPSLAADLSVLSDQAGLGTELTGFLSAVYARRSDANEQHYVRHVPGIGNPEFTNEDDYAEAEFPNAGLQLLALFRLWGVMEYWSPYRDLVDGDWLSVLSAFIPRLASAGSKDEYILEMFALAGRVCDTHTNLWNVLDHRPPTGSGHVPVAVRFIQGHDGGDEAVVTRTVGHDGSESVDLLPGDVVVAVDGVAIAELVGERAPYYPASNRPTQLRDLARSLLAGPVGPVQVDVVRDDRPRRVAASRIPKGRLNRQSVFHDRPGETFQQLSADVAYLRLSSVVAANCAAYITKAQGTKGLIVDLRNYPSEFVPFALGQHLVTRPSPFARFTTAHASNPGSFTMGESVALSPAMPHYGGRVVVLVDEVTQSQAEYTTLALSQAPDAVVVGSTTAGADGNVSTVPLPGGLATMISGIGVYTADCEPTQRVGIHVDVPAAPTLPGIRAGRDEVLECGVQQILGPNTPSELITTMTRPI